jgi:hypothetical protein
MMIPCVLPLRADQDRELVGPMRSGPDPIVRLGADQRTEADEQADQDGDRVSLGVG